MTMKRTLHSLLATGLIWLSSLANPAQAATNAAPLGLELGVATRAQVHKELGSRKKLKDAGTNKYSQGPMLQSDGTGLDVEGLSEVTFIFDKSERLSGVLMTLPKGGLDQASFNQVMNALAGKYKVVSRQVPFVGDRLVRYEHGQSVVELDAPHLSFEMNLRYLTRQLQDDFRAQSAAEAQQKRQIQNSMF